MTQWNASRSSRYRSLPRSARSLASNASCSLYRSLPRSAARSLAWNASRSSRYRSLPRSARSLASNASRSSRYRSLPRSARSSAWNASRSSRYRSLPRWVRSLASNSSRSSHYRLQRMRWKQSLMVAPFLRLVTVYGMSVNTYTPEHMTTPVRVPRKGVFAPHSREIL